MADITLWQIGDELEAITAEIMEAEGVLTPELEARLDAIDGAFAAKAERVALQAQRYKALAAGAKQEKDRLAGIYAAYSSVEQSLKAYLLAQLERAGRDRIDTTKVRIRRQASPPSIRWTGSADEIPEQFRRVQVDFWASAARDAWKSGDVLPAGVEVVQAHHIRIL